MSTKTKKRGGFVDIKLRGAPDSDNSEEEENKVSRPSPLVKKGLTKVGKKKGDSAAASPVNVPQSPTISYGTLSHSNEVAAVSTLETPVITNVVSDVISYTSNITTENNDTSITDKLQEESNDDTAVTDTVKAESNDTAYIEAHWDEDAKRQETISMKKISSNSSINNESKVKVDTPKTPLADSKEQVETLKTSPIPFVPSNVPRRKRETTAVARPVYLPDEDDGVDVGVVSSKPAATKSKSIVSPSNEIDDFVPTLDYNYDDMSDENRNLPVVRHSPPHSPLTTTTRTRSIDSADASGVEEILAVRKEKIKSKKGNKTKERNKKKSKEEYSESLDL